MNSVRKWRELSPSNCVLAKLSYFSDLKNSEMLFGNRIGYALDT